MNAQIGNVIVFQFGDAIRREVIVNVRTLRNGKQAYITIDAFGNSNALFRYVPCQQRHIVSIDEEPVEHFQDFMHVTDLIRQWKELTRSLVEVSESYSIGHNGSDTIEYSEVNVVHADARHVEIVKRLYKRQAQLAALIRESVNQVQKVSA